MASRIIGKISQELLIIMNNPNITNKTVSGLPFSPHESYHRRYVNHLFEQYGSNINGRVLDLGAKTNEEERYNSFADIDEYIALDVVRREGTELDILGDGSRLPMKPNSFHTVIMSELLEHIPLPRVIDCLKEAQRVLKPGGSLLLSTPFVYPLHGDADFQRISSTALTTLLTEAGFSQIIAIQGGGYTETLLHIIYHPICFDIAPKFGLGTRLLGWPFVLFHYFAIGLSNLPWTSLSKEPPHLIGEDNLYITNFCVAKMMENKNIR